MLQRVRDALHELERRASTDVREDDGTTTTREEGGKGSAEAPLSCRARRP